MLVGADEDRVVATVVARLTERVLARARAPGGQALEEVVAETLIDERVRLEDTHEPRADADRAFYARVHRELARGAPSARALVRDVVTHYAEEDPRALRPARLRARRGQTPARRDALIRGARRYFMSTPVGVTAPSCVRNGSARANE